MRILTLVGLVMVLAQPVGAQIRGQVIDDSKGSGVPAAVVVLLSSAGDSLASAIADGEGRFGVAWAGAPGEYRLRVRALGYAGESAILRYDGGPSVVMVRVEPQPVELGGLAVTVARRSEYLDRMGFYQREIFGRGEFLDVEALERPAPGRTAHYLERMPGVRVAGGREPFFSRSQKWGSGGAVRTCYPIIVVDDVPVRIQQPSRRAGNHFDRIVPPPMEVAAIEAYPTAALTPPRWQSTSNDCGVIAIWTKR